MVCCVGWSRTQLLARLETETDLGRITASAPPHRAKKPGIGKEDALTYKEQKMEQLLYLLESTYHKYSFELYFAFILSRPPLGNTSIGAVHHILPRSLFPDHAKNPDNLIRLTDGDHLRAHYRLAQAMPRCIQMLKAFCWMADIQLNRGWDIAGITADEVEGFAAQHAEAMHHRSFVAWHRRFVLAQRLRNDPMYHPPRAQRLAIKRWIKKQEGIDGADKDRMIGDTHHKIPTVSEGFDIF